MYKAIIEVVLTFTEIDFLMAFYVKKTSFQSSAIFSVAFEPLIGRLDR